MRPLGIDHPTALLKTDDLPATFVEDCDGYRSAYPGTDDDDLCGWMGRDHSSPFQEDRPNVLCAHIFGRAEVSLVWLGLSSGFSGSNGFSA